MKLTAFPPLINDRCSVLILGSMPGKKISLSKVQYYGNERNHFWRLLYALFGREPNGDYEARTDFALAQGIALWDVLSECERAGSLDAQIRNPVVNDFGLLLEDYPRIRCLFFFNGAAACKLFMQKAAPTLNGLAGKQLIRLPSSSPAHTLSFEKKLAAWQQIKDCL